MTEPTLTPTPVTAGFTRPTRSPEAAIAFLMMLRRRGVQHAAVLRAMETLPRAAFLPRRYVDLADEDVAVPIPCGQTATAPAALGMMISALDPEPRGYVLEVGTGSGYGSAILARCCRGVVTLERWNTLAVEARGRMKTLGLRNVEVVRADALAPLKAERPFGRIIVHAALEAVPRSLLDCLASDGRIVFARIVRGASDPVLMAGVRNGAELDLTELGPVPLAPIEAGLSAAL